MCFSRGVLIRRIFLLGNLYITYKIKLRNLVVLTVGKHLFPFFTLPLNLGYRVPGALAIGQHLLPFRTEKLSLSAPMVPSSTRESRSVPGTVYPSRVNLVGGRAERLSPLCADGTRALAGRVGSHQFTELDTKTHATSER